MLGRWLRKQLRTWLGVADPVAADEDASPKLSIHPQSLNAQLVKAGERFIVQRQIKPPDLPPNVRAGFVYDSANDPGSLGAPVLAFDDAANAPMWAYMNQNCGLGFPGYGYLSELTQRSEYRSPTETIATEMTREWIDVTVRGKASKKKRKARGETVDEEEGVDADGDGDVDGGLEDKIEELENALDEFKVRDLFRKIAEVDGFFGRAQLFIDMDPGNKDEDEMRQLPLIVDKETIKTGTLRGFKVIEPIWTAPYSYNSTDPTRQDFYKPRAWFVIGKRTHASRLLTFVSREVPDMLKPAYNFGGLSMSQLMEPYVFQWLRTRNSVSDLIHNFSVMVLMTDMAAALAGDSNAGNELIKRAQLFIQNRDNQGLTLLDKTREELVQVGVSLANLDALQAQAQEHMAAPSHIPLVKLTGITPSGLNASSEGEIKVWYDFIRAFQIFFFGPHLKHVIQILQLHLFGDIDDAIGFEFVPLSSPTIKELAEIRKSNAETDDKYVAMGAVSNEEVRERISSDPNSGFNNLSGPAPEPPTLSEAEHGAGLQEEAAQAGHERSEEAAETAHERTLEVEKVKGKNKPKPKR